MVAGFATYTCNEVGKPFKITYKWKIGDDGVASEETTKDVDLSTVENYMFNVMFDD
jgi:hypothetical protein